MIRITKIFTVALTMGVVATTGIFSNVQPVMADVQRKKSCSLDGECVYIYYPHQHKPLSVPMTYSNSTVTRSRLR